MKKFELLEKKKDCVLLKYKGEEKYKIRDVENDDIYIGYSYDGAIKVFEDYDLDKVRKQREENFANWMAEFVEE